MVRLTEAVELRFVPFRSRMLARIGERAAGGLVLFYETSLNDIEGNGT
jgi:hypothetical protein